METDLLQTDLIALNAATPELLIEWFESLNNWGWPLLLAPQGDNDRRGALITAITERLGDDLLWRQNRVKWHVDIQHGNGWWLFDSVEPNKASAYIDVALQVHRLNVAKNYNLTVYIDDLQPGMSSKYPIIDESK